MIPEPDSYLWRELQKFSDAYIWPRTDEDAAQRMGDNWHNVALAMQQTIDEAALNNGRLPSLWTDATGILYHRNIAANLGADGYGSTVTSFEVMAKMCWDMGRTVAQIKHQIYAEVIMNAAFFAATFAMPPGIGDFVRWRLVASLVNRFSSLIRGAAGLLPHPAAVTVPRALGRFGAELAQEGVEEGTTDYVAQRIDIARGFRPDGVDWRQVGISSGAGILGEPLSRALKPVGRLGSAPAGRLADALRLGDRGKRVMQQSGHAFFVNGISSPVSSTAAYSIADGTFWQTLADPGKYLHAVYTGGLTAGALGASRIVSVHAGDALGQGWSNALRDFKGMSPYTPPPPPGGQPQAVVGTQAGAVTDPGTTATTGPGTAAAGAGASADGHSGSAGGHGAGGSSGAASHATGSSGTTGHQTSSQHAAHSDDSSAGHRRLAQQSDQAIHEEQQQPATNETTEDATEPATQQDAADGETTTSADGTQSDADGLGESAATGEQGAPADTTAGVPGATDGTADQTSAVNSTETSDSGMSGESVTEAGQQTTTQSVAHTSTTATSQPVTTAQTTAAHTVTPGTHQANGQVGAQPGVPVNAKGNKKSAIDDAAAESATEATADESVTDQTADEAVDARAEALARGADFAKLHTVDFVPDVDGFQGRESVVPPDGLPTGPSNGTNGPMTAAAVAAPTGVPRAANAAHRGPANRGDAGSAGPVHTTSSRSEEEAGRPEARSGPKGPIDNDPPPPPKHGPADEADGRDDPENKNSDPAADRANDSAVDIRSDLDSAHEAGIQPSDVQTEQSDLDPAEEGGLQPVGERVMEVEPGPTFEQAAYDAFVAALNERDVNGALTPAAQELRQYYYQTPDVSKRTGEPTTVVKRFGRGKAAEQMTFPAAEPGGPVRQVAVPVLRYLHSGNFGPIEVVPSRPVGRTEMNLDDPELRLTPDDRNNLQRWVDRWMKSMGKLRRLVRRPTEAERAARQELTDQEYRRLLDEATRVNGLRPQQTGEAMGEAFASVMLRWLEAQHPGEVILRVPGQTMGGSGRFDQVYVRMGDNGKILGFAVVEAKSVQAALGTRRGPDGKSYQQGHREYVRSILAAMARRPGPLNEMGIATAMEAAIDAGDLRYLVVKPRVELLPRRARAKGIAITEYDLTPDPGTGENAQGSPAELPTGGPAGLAGGPRMTRWFAGNQVTRPLGAPVVGESVVAELTSVVPEPDPAVARRQAELAARRGTPLRDGRPVGRTLFGNAGLGALGVAVDPAAFAAIEDRLAELIRAGHQAKLTITRVARASAAAASYRFTLEVTDAQGNKTPYSALDLTDLAARLTEAPDSGAAVRPSQPGLLADAGDSVAVDGYGRLLATVDSSTPERAATEAARVAADVASYEETLTNLPSPPPGWSFSAQQGLEVLPVLGVEVDPVALAAIEAKLAELNSDKVRATLTVTRIVRPTPDSSPYRFTFEVRGVDKVIRAGQEKRVLNEVLATHTSLYLAELVARMSPAEQSLPGRQTRFQPGWLLVNLALPEVIQREDVLAAAGIAEVQGKHGEYRVTGRNGTYQLFIRVRPLPVEVTHQTASVPSASPTAWVTVSDQVPTTELPGLIARILAQTAAATLNPSPAQLAEAADKPVFTPGSDPWSDARLEDTDRGDLAEVNQLESEYKDAEQTKSRLRRRAIHRAMADLFVRMGVHKDQPDAQLRRTLAPENVRDLAGRIENRRPLSDNRLTKRAYLVRALRTSTWSSLLVGAAAFTVTGDFAQAIGIALPTAVFGLTGAPMEYWLDGHKSAHKKPSYGADQARRNQQYPGLRGTVDGQQRASEAARRVPRTTGRPRYAVRHAVPLAAAAMTAGALSLAGVPVLSTLTVLAATAVVRTITERWVDAKKRDHRRARVDANVLKQLANPDSAQNQLIAFLQEQQQLLSELREALGRAAATNRPITSPAKPAQHEIRSPGTPPYRVHLGQQALENDAAASARALHPRLAPNDVDLTEVAKRLGALTEAIIAAWGAAVGGALLASIGDKIFMTVEERLHDLQKNWDYAQREAIRGQALIDAMAQPLQHLDEALQDLARLAGAGQSAPDLADRTADRRSRLTPQEAEPGPRPSRKVPFVLYGFQIFLGAAGTAGAVLVLDAVLGLNPLTVWTTVAGAAGALTGTPVARMVFRRNELDRKDENAQALNKQGVDRSELNEQVALGKYLVAQLLDQIHQVRDNLLTAGSPPVVVSPADADYTDRVRAAAELAARDDVVGGPRATPEELDVRRHRVAALTWIDRVAADVDWADATDPGSAEAARQRARLADAISRYQSIAGAGVAAKPFPDLASASPARGRRVTGGPTDQIRAGAARALGRMLGEPGDKPLLVERLAALEAIVAAADALDVHAEHATTQVGTEESHAFLFEQLAGRITVYNELLLEANIVGGFPLPAVSPSAPPDAGPSPGPSRGRFNSPPVDRTRYEVGGRTDVDGPLTVDKVVEQATYAETADFGGLLEEGPTLSDGLVVVRAQDGQQHYFRAEEPAPVGGRNLAETRAATGARDDPHRVTVDAGVADDQLTRVWVHEISHTLQELQAPPSGPVRRLLNKLTGRGHNACVEAQQNEFRYLTRQWAAAVEANDTTETNELRTDLKGLADAIEHRGGARPTLPWDGPPILGPSAQLKASIAEKITALDRTTANLRALVDAKHKRAEDAEKEARKAAQKAEKADRAKDEGRFDRKRAADADAKKHTDVANWHSQLEAGYQRALDKATAARDGYQQLLAGYDASTPDAAAAEITRVTAEATAYREILEGLAPSDSVLGGLMPTGRLPHLTALAEQVNRMLSDRGIDERFTAADLQHRLNAKFGDLAIEEGAVLRVGRERTAELRIRLTADELTEVATPPVRASEIIIGRLPQPVRKLATAMTSVFNYSNSGSLNGILAALASALQLPALEQLTLTAKIGHGNSRAVTANATEIARPGAVEDNRGESVLFSGKASYQVDIRTSRARGWGTTDKVDGSEELRVWVSHAYTAPAATNVTARKDLRTRLPGHSLTSISGLEQLTDDVIAKNDRNLRRLGADRAHVEEQIHAAVTQDLPGRLAESTDRPVLRPLMAGAKPIGYLEVETTIRYEEIKLEGAQSRTHWQEAVRVGVSAVNVQQDFRSNDSETLTAGYGGEFLQDVDDDGHDVAPALSGSRSVSRSESVSGGGTTYHVAVHRFTGPTQGYRMVLDHKVKLVLNGREAHTTDGTSRALMRVPVKDAYRHGLPVDSAAVIRGGARPELIGDVQTGVEVPGRKLELPDWSVRDGKLRAAGPWNIQRVTGGKEALKSIIEHLSEKGFVPPLDSNDNPDLSKLSRDPVERHGQLLNLEELRTQLSAERLEAGYDIAARDGIVVTLTLPGSTQPADTISLRIGIDQRAVEKPAGVTTDEAVVLLNIGSETAGRSGGRTRALPLRAGSDLAGPTEEGPARKSALSYGRQVLGRAVGWLGGATINQVTLVESNGPVAVFEVPHTLTVTEIGTGKQIHRSTGESARLLIDSGFLPYADIGPGEPSPWQAEQPMSGPVPAKVLDRATLLALDTSGLTDLLPPDLRSDPTALQQLSAFLNPRNLLAHPEWASTGCRTTIAVPGPGGVSRRVPITVTGRIRDAKVVGQTDGTAGDINFALGSHGVSSARPTGGSTDLGQQVVEPTAEPPTPSADGSGGGLRGSRGHSGSTSRTDLHIWGIERLTIETGRHDVFDAVADFELTVGDHAPVTFTSGVAFQLAERDTLRFYSERAFGLSLRRAADAVERYLRDDLSLDRRAAAALIRRYHAELETARPGNRPELAAGHTPEALADKLLNQSAGGQGSPSPSPVDPVARLQEVLVQASAQPAIELPAHYREHLGSSLVESADLTREGADVQLLSEVESMLRDELGVDLQHDPALAHSLFADLAGKRWWGRLEDMLGPGGMVRHYPVGRPRALAAQQVSVRIHAEFTDDVKYLGEAKDVVSIVQRYLYDENSRTLTKGRSTAGGVDALLDEIWSGSVGTDLVAGSSTTIAEQLTRLERIATFAGMTRVGRGLRITVAVSHDAVNPNRGGLRRRIGADEEVNSAEPRTLTGGLVQLVPNDLIGQSRGTTPARTAVPNEDTPLRMPATYFVEGTGPGQFGQPELLEVLLDKLRHKSMLGAAGLRMHQAELESLFSASNRHALFSRMASEEGFQLDGLTRLDSSTEVVDVTLRAEVSAMELVSGPIENGELGDVNRSQHTVSTSTTTGRRLPVSGSVAVPGTGGNLSAGEQVTDTTTDAWGERGERSRFERGPLVTVRVRVDYDITLTSRSIGRDGAVRAPRSVPHRGATTGEAFLTMHQHEYEALLASAQSGHVVYAPENPATSFVANGRPAAEGTLSPGKAAAAVLRTRKEDYGGLLTDDPRLFMFREGALAVVDVRGFATPQHFRVRIGEVPPHRMGFTELRTGTENDPHVVTFAPGIANDQLARLWVHEISHTVQELEAPDGGPVRRLVGQLTGGRHDACVEAQYNEFRFLVRQWVDAADVVRQTKREADRDRMRRIRYDAECLGARIEGRGYPPPAYPWLTAREVTQVYAERRAQLIPPNPPDRAPGERPRFLVIAGQPAAGKSTTQARLQATRGDDVAYYDSDDNLAVHPRYEALIREWGTAATELIMYCMPKDLHQRCTHALRSGGIQYDILASHPMAAWQRAESWVQEYRRQGYRVSVVYIATNGAGSLLGVADRYQSARDELRGGRWLDARIHDQLYDQLPLTAQLLEALGLVDDIYVVTRDGYVLYQNHRDAGGAWKRGPAVRDAIIAERDRPPTPQERERFDRIADRLLNGRDPALPPLEDAVRRTVEEAVRREHARGEPRPGTRDFDDSDRVDNRLDPGRQTREG